MGFIPVNSVFSTSGPIVAGIESMLSIVCFEVFLFALLALTKKSGVFDELLDTVTNSCKTEKSAEVTTCVMVVLATCATAINVAAILIVGPIANKLFRNFNLDRNRGANFLDGLACATTGLIPYNATMMTMFNLAVGTGVLSETFQITDAIVYNFHCMMLMVLFFLAAITGIGKRKEKNED